MKKALKNIIALICIISMLGSSAVFAADEVHITYTNDSGNVTATATVTADGENRVLVVSSYKNGLLKEIKTDRLYVDGTATLSASVRSGVDEVIANVIDGFGGNTASSKAVYAADTVEVRGIKVNGEDLEDLSSDINEYTLQCDEGEADIEVILADSTTNVEIIGNTSPGKAEIKLTSSRGRKRNITLNLYDSEEKTYTLSNLTYKIGEEEYEIPGFNPDTISYSVELPDNTMSVRLFPESVGQVKTYVTDTWVSSIDGVELGSIVDVASNAYPYKRNSLSNLIPVKNEIATAEIVVSNGEEGRNNKETTYTIEFTARQPRLTEFNLTGCAEDRIKPAFVGGSAVNNDNGTMPLSDRGWAVGNISESLLGGSAFMFVAENKNSGQWWYDNSSGEYFNFTADTPGRITVLSANTFTNSSEYTDAGWTGFSKSAPSIPDGDAVNYRQVPKDWNNYAECNTEDRIPEYFMSCVQYNSANATSKRAQDPWINYTTEFDSLSTGSMGHGYTKTFEAGENVSIYHSGRKDGNSIMMMAVINWDESMVNYAPAVETEAEGGEEELLPELPSLKVSDPSVIIDVAFAEDTDIASGIWEDNSGRDNHITLTPGVGQWTQEGYKVESGAGKITLPEAVSDVLETANCTIQFEIADTSIDEGSDGIVLFSQNGERFIISSSAQVQMMRWSTTLQRPKFDYSLLAGKKHTIVFDNENSKIYWYIEGEAEPIVKTLKATDTSITELAFGTDDTEYAGSVTFKSFKVYDRVLGANEITGGEAE